MLYEVITAHPVHAQSHAQSEVMNFSNGEMKQQSLRKNTLSVDKAKKDFSDVLKAGLEGKESGVAAALASSLGTAERAVITSYSIHYTKLYD